MTLPELPSHLGNLPEHRSVRNVWAPHSPLRNRILAILLASAGCLPVLANAADTKHPHARSASNVIMMIGGMADGDHIAASAPSTPSADPLVTSEAASKLSVVIQPSAGQISPSAPSSASVESRVMALAPLVDEVARNTDLDSALLMAVIDTESGGNPQAISSKGASGLMQLMPETGARHGATNLFDPRQNIAAGARYLRRLLRQFGDVQLALAAYNAGEGAVRKYGDQIPPYAETMKYVPKVMGRYLRYRSATNSVNDMSNDATTKTPQERFLLVRQSIESD
ncbi:lytic transglycosylase domain-containing protein [Paraburkholderia sp. IW21]|uniref:lytic transglycosylase domain-containing protein n=1 Tax=Paraburkholderia sp. IW21 TaxID=3242488 RepID=UPI0035202B20